MGREKRKEEEEKEADKRRKMYKRERAGKCNNKSWKSNRYISNITNGRTFSININHVKNVIFRLQHRRHFSGRDMFEILINELK